MIIFLMCSSIRTYLDIELLNDITMALRPAGFGEGQMSSALNLKLPRLGLFHTSQGQDLNYRVDPQTNSICNSYMISAAPP